VRLPLGLNSDDPSPSRVTVDGTQRAHSLTLACGGGFQPTVANEPRVTGVLDYTSESEDAVVKTVVETVAWVMTDEDESASEAAAAIMMMVEVPEEPERTLKEWQDEIDSHNEPGTVVHWCNARVGPCTVHCFFCRGAP
jgi:hypothetical protein